MASEHQQMPNVLLIDAGSLHAKKPYLERILTYPASFWIVENSAGAAAGHWYQDLVAQSHILAVDFRDPRSAANELAGVLKDRGITVQGVTTYYEDTVRLAQLTAAVLGLPKICQGDPGLLRNKGAMRNALAKGGVPQPRYRRCSTLDDAYDAADMIGFPCIVKPVEMSASIGVAKVTERTDLASAFERAMTVDYDEGEDSRHAYGISSGAMVEEYIDSALEISCEGFAANGAVSIVGITEARLQPAPSFKEQGHRMPCLLLPEVELDVRNVVRGACSALGLQNTTFHAELLVGSDGTLAFLELGARLPGGHIPFALEAASGFDLISTSIDLCLGKPAPSMPSTGKSSAIEFITEHSRLALLRSAYGQLDSLNELVSLTFYEGVSRGRLGHLIWKANNREELETVRQRIDAIANSLS